MQQKEKERLIGAQRVSKANKSDDATSGYKGTESVTRKAKRQEENPTVFQWRALW